MNERKTLSTAQLDACLPNLACYLSCLCYEQVRWVFIFYKVNDIIKTSLLQIILSLIFLYLSVIFSQWATVFPPCEQFLRRLWTLTGSHVKGGSGGGTAAVGTNEGKERLLSSFLFYPACINL